MNLAPIIHTRTFSSDFDSNIKVVPAEFTGSDINWARKKILEATKSIDSLQGERWLIIDNNQYRIAGVIGFIKNICSKTNKKEDKSLEPLFYDEKNRLVYAFIGVVIDKANTQEVTSITYDMLWDYFEKFMRPIWKNSYQEQVLTQFEDVAGSKVLKSKTAEKNIINNMELYESNSVLDYNLFNNIVADLTNSDFSLCTNMGDISVVKNATFDYISTSANNITRLKKEPRPSEIVDKTIENNVTESFSEESITTDSNEKKNDLTLAKICLTILLVIIVIVILLMKIDLFQ